MAPDLIRIGDLAPLGRDGDVRAGLRARSLVRIRHGAYIARDAWEAAKTEERARIRARAHASAVTGRRSVYAFTTAAAFWRLPLSRGSESVVHTVENGGNPARSRADVIRHSGALPLRDVVEIDGLLVTSLSRTVFDVIRSESGEAAVACFDAALRSVAWRPAGAYDDAAVDSLRQEVLVRVAASRGRRGIRQARFVTAFADGRAQLPGESISRLWMHRLGAPAPILQSRVDVGGGRAAYLDFAWEQLRMFGEFDGDGKYVDPQLAGGRDPRAVLREQRSREADIIAATGWTPVRWGWERLRSLDTFEAFLRAQRILS